VTFKNLAHEYFVRALHGSSHSAIHLDGVGGIALALCDVMPLLAELGGLQLAHLRLEGLNAGGI
jgi:hypothetical protein